MEKGCMIGVTPQGGYEGFGSMPRLLVVSELELLGWNFPNGGMQHPVTPSMFEKLRQTLNHIFIISYPVQLHTR